MKPIKKVANAFSIQAITNKTNFPFITYQSFFVLFLSTSIHKKYKLPFYGLKKNCFYQHGLA